jgi:hypothetical protein
MSDLNTAPETQSLGQPESDQAAVSVSDQTPVVESGQAEAQRDATIGQAESTHQVVDSFFDPSKLPDELKGVYKQMQAAYTKKTQTLAQQRQKVEAYDAFMQDPISNMQRVAGQYGMTLTRAQAQAAVQAQAETESEWQPKTWDDVLSKAEERAMEKIMQKLGPVVQNVQAMQAGNIENQLNTIDPNWRIYEEDMRGTIQRHPTLVNDVSLLYRMSVPEDVYTGRAVQQALKKFENKARSATVGSKSDTPRSAPAFRKVGSFSEAVEEAKRMLSEHGR